MPQNNANKASYLSAIAMSIACRSTSRGEKNIYSRCFEGFDKSDRNHYEGKIALTCQNTLRTSKELFKSTIRIFVSQNCSNCTCFMLILYFFSEFFLFFSFRNPRGSLKEVVNREDMYHQLLVMNPSLFGGNSQSENSFELSCAFLDITNYYCQPYYAWLHEVQH